MIDIMDAKGKLRPASILAIIGGIGIGLSALFPYFSVTFLITISLNAFDLGLLVWGPLALSAILSLIAGINLNGSLGGNPKVCLVISTLSVLFSWFIVYLQYQYYYEYSIQEMGFAIPLNFEIGLILGAFSSLMIIVSTIIVFSNQNSYIFLINTYKQQRLRLYQQSQQQAPLDPYISQISPSYHNSLPHPATSTYHFCTNCGTKNEAHQKYCIHCGNSLQINNE
ncbi:MAG: zinc ribbon domain-containing protein [Promethearchaeota archaeon]